jgi:hypothetical protein
VADSFLRFVLKGILVLALVLNPAMVLCGDGIITDRPDFTESSSIVSRGSIQVELGGSFARSTGSDDDRVVMPGALFRFGILEGIELRAASSYEHESAQSTASGTTTRGLGGLMLGGKIRLWEVDPGIQAALLAHTHLPVGHEDFRPADVEAEAILAVSAPLADGIGLGSNIGIRWDSGVQSPAASYSSSFGIPLDGQVGVFLEYFGIFLSGSSPSHNIDAGLTYLLSPFVQVDISGGASPAGAGVDWTLGAGISFGMEP